MGFLQGAQAALGTSQAIASQDLARRNQNAQLGLMREQQDIANTTADVENDQREGKQNFSDIFLASGKVDLVQDWNALQGTHPELLERMSDSRPEYQTFTDESGKIQQAQFHAYVPAPNPDDGYIVQLRRMDTGDIVPLTEGKSAAAGDGPRIISKEEFAQNIEKRWQAGISKDYLVGSAGALLVGESNLGAVQNQQQLTDMTEAILDKAATTKLANDPAAMAEFYARVTETNDLNVLKELFTKIGGDTDALLERATAKATDLWTKSRAENKSAGEEGSIEKLLADKGITKEKWEGYDKETRRKVIERLDLAQMVDYTTDVTGGKLLAFAEDLISMPYDFLINDLNAMKESGVGRALGFSDIDAPATPRREYDSAQQENDAAAMRKQAYVTERRVDAAFATMPPAALTAENVRKAIMDGTQKPTQEQLTEIHNLLGHNQIKTDAQLVEKVKSGQINRQNASRIAMMMAMTEKGDSTKKMALHQKLMNSFERGDQEVGLAQVDAMANNAQTRSNQNVSNQINLDKHREAVRKYNSEQAKQVADDTQPWLDSVLETVGLSKKNEDGTYSPTDDDFSGGKDEAKIIGRSISGLMGKMRQLRKGDEQAAAVYMDRLSIGVGMYVQAMVNGDTNNVFSQQNFLDVFRDEADGTMDIDSSRIRPGAYKTVNGKQKMTSIAYVDESGVNSQTVDLALILKDHPQVANFLITAATKNSK